MERVVEGTVLSHRHDLFAIVRGVLMSVEEQERGSGLHAHALVWARILPELLIQQYGSPSYFVTFSPDDVET